MGIWQDRDERYSVDWPVSVEVPGESVPHEARIFNISGTGVSILMSRPVNPQVRVKLSVTVPTSIAERVLLPNPMPLHVEVVWCRELLDVNQVGTKFLYLNPLIRRMMEKAFADFSDDIIKGSGNS